MNWNHNQKNKTKIQWTAILYIYSSYRGFSDRRLESFKETGDESACTISHCMFIELTTMETFDYQ